MEKELKCSNIPLNETIILRTLRLINKTISEEVLKYWIKKCRANLECEKKERKDLENHKKLLESELKKKKKMNYPDDKDSSDMLFAHEFLFLLCNTKNRLGIIDRMPRPEFTTEKKSLKKYEMQALDAARLDRVFKVDLNLSHKAGSYNPQDVIQKVLKSDLGDRKVRIDGIKSGGRKKEGQGVKGASAK
eukprot:CAMPEP_0170567122 /NCGR_PEP_ID=MMETSP0211-20121228/80280_1 /TAXON_ID=311385 /ORGANISM="Pseudokeronopsis sp., Strain OXSARD2" /LENGTH=189 /DNA_ID=CAMNT_0010888497 /DNA_START=307 /DNA_END=876 /DNA_ORIENTATION=-